MGSGTFRSFDLNLQQGPGKLVVGQGQTAKIDEKRSLFAPKYVIFVSCKFANYFVGIEKFPVNRKTAENNTLSPKKLKYFTELSKDFGHFYYEIVGDIRALQNFENRV